MLKKILKYLIDFLDLKHEKCFEKMKNEKGVCYGTFDVDNTLCHLSTTCVGCKYHTFISPNKK